jgi:predicted Rossmann fold nucleotide-binding protein DprA/Smf involved in DNA uptake
VSGQNNALTQVLEASRRFADAKRIYEEEEQHFANAVARYYGATQAKPKARAEAVTTAVKRAAETSTDTKPSKRRVLQQSYAPPVGGGAVVDTPKRRGRPPKNKDPELAAMIAGEPLKGGTPFEGSGGDAMSAVLAALADGPLSSGDLLERTGLSQSTYYAATAKLRAEKRIVKEDGAYRISA